MAKKATKVFITKLVVKGTGEFPLDMLRHDSCVPATEHDTSVIRESDPTVPRVVTLRRFSVNGFAATERRWKSFGWTVMIEEPIV